MTATVRAALAAASLRLTAAGVPGAGGDARRLMAAALGLPAERLSLATADPLPEAARVAFEGFVAARLGRQPVAQILGRRLFWSRDFEVTPDVLDPRPETETLVAFALDGPAAARVLDLGVGSGAILITLLAEWPDAQGLGVDVSAAALAVAARNAARHGVAARASWRRSDWFDAVSGGFELIVANPPYIPACAIGGLAPEVRDWEPRLALTPGPSGLESYGRIAAGLDAALAPSGRALLEIGAGQGGAVAALFAAAGFTPALHPDLDGRDRVVSVRRRRPTG